MGTVIGQAGLRPDIPSHAAKQTQRTRTELWAVPQLTCVALLCRRQTAGRRPDSQHRQAANEIAMGPRAWADAPYSAAGELAAIRQELHQAGI